VGATPSGLTSTHLNHPPIFFTGWMPFLPPYQQHQNTTCCYYYNYRSVVCNVNVVIMFDWTEFKDDFLFFWNLVFEVAVWWHIIDCAAWGNSTREKWQSQTNPGHFFQLSSDSWLNTKNHFHPNVRNLISIAFNPRSGSICLSSYLCYLISWFVIRLRTFQQCSVSLK